MTTRSSLSAVEVRIRDALRQHDWQAAAAIAAEARAATGPIGEQLRRILDEKAEPTRPAVGRRRL